MGKWEKRKGKEVGGKGRKKLDEEKGVKKKKGRKKVSSARDRTCVRSTKVELNERGKKITYIPSRKLTRKMVPIPGRATSFLVFLYTR